MPLKDRLAGRHFDAGGGGVAQSGEVGAGSQGAQVLDGDAVPLGQPLGDQRAVAGLGVALDTEQRRGAKTRQR